MGTIAGDGGPDQPSGCGDLTIGDMARAVGITPRALRFYEHKGLLSPRRDGAMRLYGRAERERLGLVLRAKRLGFTLGEIRQILAAPDGPAEAGELNISRRQCFDQIKLLEARKREIEAALAELRRTYSSFYARMVEGAVRNRV
jgi:DNA-binding transcriptional MerR regulator